MKKWLNTTPKEYINKVRLEHAYTMIVSTDQRFDDIAYDVGFSSVSHFNDLVKKNYGFTPAELRKRYM
jgi:AraC-like DNA-binding protein